MKILVTGGAGYIGRHLVDFLIEKGHEVVVIDRKFLTIKRPRPKLTSYLGDIRYTEKILMLDWNPVLVLPRDEYGDCGSFYAFITYDEIKKFYSLKDLFLDEKFDIIFHLAAVSRTPWAVLDPIYTYETNVVGSANILQTAREAGVSKVILASSNIVYAAQTPYKTSKLAMEQVARDYSDLYGLPTVCLRFSNVAGGIIKRQHDDNVLKSLAKSKKKNGYITITGDGEQTRNFTNVKDICEALWLASQAEVRGTEIDIMHPKTWSLNEIAKYFDCPIHYVPDRKGDIKHLKMGIGVEKAKELIGFEAKIGLEEYIQDYINY